MLFDAGTGNESIKRYFTEGPAEMEQTVDLKLVLVAPDAARSGHGRTLVELLEREAIAAGKREILCTIHPKNVPSMRLFGMLGYRRLRTVTTKYGKRHVYGRSFAMPAQRWTR